MQCRQQQQQQQRQQLEQRASRSGQQAGRSRASSGGRAASPPRVLQRCESPSAEPRAGRLHDSRLYRAGVLLGVHRRPIGDLDLAAPALTADRRAKLPLSWEEALGGPRALLVAARDADDQLVRRIVSLANKAGLAGVQLNAQDSSGRGEEVACTWLWINRRTERARTTRGKPRALIGQPFTARQTAISYLAGNGSAAELEACLALPGAKGNLPDNEANTPLHFAAQAGQTECLNVLLQRCADIEVDARNQQGFTPLMKAAVQGRSRCAKLLLFAGADPALRDHGRGLRAEQWARFCGRHGCAELIERLARQRPLERSASCRRGSEPELAERLLPTRVAPGLGSRLRRVFRTSSSSGDRAAFSLAQQLTSAALCASSPLLPRQTDASGLAAAGLRRPLSVPQLRITLVTCQDVLEKPSHSATCADNIESTMVKPPRTRKKSK